MRKTWSSGTLADAVSEAQEEVNELADGMRDAFDGLPDSLKEYHRRREAAADQFP